MLAATLSATLLGSMLASKSGEGIIRADERVIRVGEVTIRAGQDF